MTINYLVTHSGGFHADELLSSAVLTRLFPEADLLRSRDELCITPVTGLKTEHYFLISTTIVKRMNLTVHVGASISTFSAQSTRLGQV